MPYLPGNFYQPTFEETRDADVDPYGSYYFALEIVDSGGTTEVAHFMECSGLKNSATVFEIEEGGLNGRSHKRPGQSKWENVKLMYATSASTYLLAWRDQFLQDQFHKRVEFTGHITLKDNHGVVIRRYTFEKAWPVSWEGPTLNSNSSELAIETLEIAHDGLTISGPEDDRPTPEWFAAEIAASSEAIDPNRFRTEFVTPAWLGSGEFDALRDGTTPTLRGVGVAQREGVGVEFGESDAAVTEYTGEPGERPDPNRFGDDGLTPNVQGDGEANSEGEGVSFGDSEVAARRYAGEGEATGESDQAVGTFVPNAQGDGAASHDGEGVEFGDSEQSVGQYSPNGMNERPDADRFGDEGLTPNVRGSEGYDPDRHTANNYAEHHGESEQAVVDHAAALLAAALDAIDDASEEGEEDGAVDEVDGESEDT